MKRQRICYEGRRAKLQHCAAPLAECIPMDYCRVSWGQLSSIEVYVSLSERSPFKWKPITCTESRKERVANLA